MSSIAKEMVKIVSDSIPGLIIGKNLFSSSLAPNKPDRIVNIKLTGSSSPDMPSIDYQRAFVKIICRESLGNQVECEELANRIRIVLRKIGAYEFDDSKIISIEHIFGPMDIGPDGLYRPIYSIDFVVNRTGSEEEFRYYDNQGDCR